MFYNLPANSYQPMAHKYQPETAVIVAAVKLRCRRESWINSWELQRLYVFLDEHTDIREAIAEAMKECWGHRAESSEQDE